MSRTVAEMFPDLSGKELSRAIRAERLKHKEFIRKSNAAERAKRSPEQQIERLDRILGKGIGAVRERAKLAKLIEERKEKELKQKQAQAAKLQTKDTGSRKNKGNGQKGKRSQ